MLALPSASIAESAFWGLAPWRLLVLAILGGLLLLLFHCLPITRLGMWQQLCCLGVQGGLVVAMQVVMPSSLIGYLFLSTVIQAVYLFGAWVWVPVAILVWLAWGSTAIIAAQSWMEWLGANIYAIFLIVAVTLAAAAYTYQHRIKVQVEGVLLRLQGQYTAALLALEQVQQAATQEERLRLVRTVSTDLRATLSVLEQTVSGAIAQAQAGVAQTQPLLNQTQLYVRETVDSLRATLATLRPTLPAASQAEGAGLEVAALVPASSPLLTAPLLSPAVRLLLEWLPLAFICMAPLLIMLEGRGDLLIGFQSGLFCAMLLGCYLYTLWRQNSPWFQLGLVGQACSLLGMALVTHSPPLLVGLAVIAGQLALRCNWAQMITGFVVLQGAVGLAAGLLNQPPWQLVATMLLFGMVSTVLVFPLISARRRFDQRSAAGELLQKLGQQVAALNTRADELRQLAATAERHRVAREIHDGLGHYLMTIAIQLHVAQEALPEDPAASLRQLQEVRLLICEAQQHLVGSVDALNPLPDQPGALEAALRLLVTKHNQGGGEVLLRLEGQLDQLPSDVELALFRTAQEGLTNAFRHGRASEVAINVVCWPALVRVIVEDNGVGGGEAPTVGAGLGLQGLRERAALLGGFCAASAGTAGGFTLMMEIPLTQALL